MCKELRVNFYNNQTIPRVVFAIVAALPFCSTVSDAFGQDTVRKFDREEQSNVNVFRRASPSVVNICTKAAVARRRGNVTLDIETIPVGSGSGFLWDADGHVVTNYHVVKGADAVQVVLADGSNFHADVIGSAPESDIAVLRIESAQKKLLPLAIGRSNDLEVGQKVYAIGNPFGLDHTLTTGIVSGLGREISSQGDSPIKGVIQTDAAINPGNSGGPLLDSQGELIGMNTAILSRSGGSAGVGFAVPVNTIKSTVPRLINKFASNAQTNDRNEQAYLGVVLAPKQISEQASDEGVLILGIAPGSPAANAGLKPTRMSEEGDIEWGDVVISVDGERATDSEALVASLQDYKIGDEVTIGIKRGEEYSRVKVKLASAMAIERSSERR